MEQIKVQGGAGSGGNAEGGQTLETIARPDIGKALTMLDGAADEADAQEAEAQAILDKLGQLMSEAKEEAIYQKRKAAKNPPPGEGMGSAMAALMALMGGDGCVC